jgi:SAM-dependent methyltransferase
MLIEAKHWWEVNGREFQESFPIPITILYGIGSPNEDELQLIGPVAGKRVLEIGCGGAQASVAFAKMGATVIGVDVAASEIAFAQELAKQNGVTIELFQRDMADLSPIATASQDIVFSSSAFQYVDELAACFLEVYRVLKPNGLFVWGQGHPFIGIIDTATLTIDRSYFDTGVHIEGAETDCPFASLQRTVSDYFNLLVDAGFVVERMVEPDSRQRYAYDPWYGQWGLTAKVLTKVPATIIFKSRKPVKSAPA